MHALEAGAARAARGPRPTRALRAHLGRRLLAMQHGDRHGLARLAAALGVSERWLRELRERARRGEEAAPVGRPRTPQAERLRVRALVAEERSRGGARAGWRTIHRALAAREPAISKTLVQEELAAMKGAAGAARRRATEAAREGLEILGRDTVWGEDTTHLGRTESGEEVAGEHVRDRATLATVALSAGAPPTSADVLALLDRAARERGGWPLVLQHDNASVYESKAVRGRLEAERVVALRSRVRTPTDNAATEHAHAEVKAESGLGKGVVLDAETARALLARARETLDVGRLRATRGWKTAAELDAIVPRGDACVDRRAFYEAARAAARDAVRGQEDPRAAREAEREAIITTLCELGLARRHVGKRPREGPIPTPFQPTQKE